MRLWSRSILASDTQLNQRSYYEASVTRPSVEVPLQGESQADVLVPALRAGEVARDRPTVARAAN